MCAQIQWSRKIRILLETELIPLLLKYRGKYGWITFEFLSINAHHIQSSELPGPCLWQWLDTSEVTRHPLQEGTNSLEVKEETGEISF